MILGAVLARPLLVRLRGQPERLFAQPVDRRLLGVALALLLVDIVVKAILAPAWAGILRPCLP